RLSRELADRGRARDAEHTTPAVAGRGPTGARRGGDAIASEGSGPTLRERRRARPRARCAAAGRPGDAPGAAKEAPIDVADGRRRGAGHRRGGGFGTSRQPLAAQRRPRGTHSPLGSGPARAAFAAVDRFSAGAPRPQSVRPRTIRAPAEG